MRTRIKFCGLVRPGDVDVAVALGADAVGFVLYPKSPRFVTPAEASGLRRRLPSYVCAVGLVVNAGADAVRSAIETVGLDVVQFHGDESPEDCERGCAGRVPFWRAVRMRSPGDLLESGRRFTTAEALLVDAFSEGYGGSGQGFDWSWIPERRERPLVLAGGLAPETVGEAIARVRPMAVDVSSAIQGPDARSKDAARMERFMAAVLAADAHLTAASSTSHR